MDIVGIAIVLLAFVGIFLLFRVFFLWYWRIDKIVELLENINKNTKPPIVRHEEPKKEKVPKKTTVEMSHATKTKKTAKIKAGLDIYDGDDKVECPDCGHTYNPKEIKCPNCGRANPYSHK